MKTHLLAATCLALVGAGPVLAQNVQDLPGQSNDLTQPSLREQPPAGAYQGYWESRDRPPEQTAEVPSVPEQRHQHPGTLKKFNSNSGYGPEVQFDVDRREAQQQKQVR